jgi:hypothetical protein
MSAVFCSPAKPGACIHFQRTCYEANCNRYRSYPTSRAAATIARMHVMSGLWDAQVLGSPLPIRSSWILRLQKPFISVWNASCWSIMPSGSSPRLSGIMPRWITQLVNDIHRNLCHLRFGVWSSPPVVFLYKCNQTDQTVDVTCKSTFPGTSAL